MQQTKNQYTNAANSSSAGGGSYATQRSSHQGKGPGGVAAKIEEHKEPSASDFVAAAGVGQGIYSHRTKKDTTKVLLAATQSASNLT